LITEPVAAPDVAKQRATPVSIVFGGFAEEQCLVGLSLE